jgi:site-specific recombinase XerD
LSPAEIEALMRAPNCETYAGRRDHALLCLAVRTGLRVSEIIGLKRGDVVFGGTGAYVSCRGKGRKERAIPLAKPTARLLKAWLHERKGEPEQPLFTNARGQELSRDGVAYILGKHVEAAAQRCRSLLAKRVSPHVLRHTNAANLLQAGADQAVIALWLGHESVDTTQVYLHADIEYKRKVLAKMTCGKGMKAVYRPSDQLLEFLNSL